MSGVQIAGLISALAVLNICFTVVVARNDLLLKRHKMVQYCIIWLVPVLGVLASAVILRSIREAPMAKSRLIPNDEDYPGVNMHPPVDP